MSEQRLALIEALGDEVQSGIGCLSRILSGKPILEGPKYHKIVHWPEWIRMYGATGNYNGEIMERAHRVTIKGWMGSLKLNDSLAAVYKVVHKHNMYEAHEADGKVDGASDDTSKFRHVGQGGFRGKIDMHAFLCLTDEQSSKLARFESAMNFPDLHAREKARRYSELIPESENGTSLKVCLNALHHNDQFAMEILSEFRSESGFVDQPNGFLRVSSVGSRQIQLWSKSWLACAKAYVQVGNDIQYVRQVLEDGKRVPEVIERGTEFQRSPHAYGRILAIFSVGNGQYMLIRRWTHVQVDGGPQQDESTDEHLTRLRLTRTGRAGNKKYRCSDSLKRYCWWMYLEMPPATGLRPSAKFSDLICLNAVSSAIDYPVKSVMFTQPDFNTCPGHDISKAPRYSFLMPFVIHDVVH